MIFDGCEYFMGTAGGGDVSDCFNFDGGGTRIRTKNEGITGRTTTGTVDGKPMGSWRGLRSIVRLPRFGPNRRIHSLSNSQDRPNGFDTTGQH